MAKKEKKTIIKLETNARPGFAMMASRRISEMLNTKVTFMEVLDELFLYECGMDPINVPLRHFVISILEDCTINWIDPKRGIQIAHTVGIL